MNILCFVFQICHLQDAAVARSLQDAAMPHHRHLHLQDAVVPHPRHLHLQDAAVPRHLHLQATSIIRHHHPPPSPATSIRQPHLNLLEN